MLDNIIEIAGVIVGVVYIYLEYKASIYLWVAGVVMPAIYIYVFYKSGLYADFGINIYYFIAGIYGWLVWRMSDKTKGGGLVIGRTPRREIIPLAVAATVFFAIIAYVLVQYTDSTVPYSDSFTTALSIVALWMLARKYVEQWLVWVVVDVACAALFIYKGLYPTAILYALYAVVAIFGYFKWLKMVKKQKKL